MPPTEKTNISVLIPTYNESKNIEPCLKALQDWADEIIILDSQSTDETVGIAHAYGAGVVQFQYNGGWPKKRQWALDNLNLAHEWVLLLDADEILDEPIRHEISQVIKTNTSDGYYLRFEIVFLGRQLKHGATALWKLSLFKHGRAAFEKRLENQDTSMLPIEIHEHMLLDSKAGFLKNPVRHENINNIHRYIEKHNAYYNWEAKIHLYGSEEDIKPAFWGTRPQRRKWLKGKYRALLGASLLRFLYCYVVRFGFLDGLPGLIYAAFKGVQVFHTKVKIYELKLANPTDNQTEMSCLTNIGVDKKLPVEVKS